MSKRPGHHSLVARRTLSATPPGEGSPTLICRPSALPLKPTLGWFCTSFAPCSHTALSCDSVQIPEGSVMRLLFDRCIASGRSCRVEVSA